MDKIIQLQEPGKWASYSEKKYPVLRDYFFTLVTTAEIEPSHKTRVAATSNSAIRISRVGYSRMPIVSLQGNFVREGEPQRTEVVSKSPRVLQLATPDGHFPAKASHQATIDAVRILVASFAANPDRLAELFSDDGQESSQK